MSEVTLSSSSAATSAAILANNQKIKLILKATDFASISHSRQLRKDGHTPYINHPIGVANILSEIGNVTDPDVIVAALLHDTVEDTDVTFQQIQTQFGHTICSIVQEVTDDKTLPSDERKRLQIVTAPNKSREAKLVKLADKLYNLRDLLRESPIGWTDQRVQQYFVWASKVIEGCRGVNFPIEQELIKVLAEKNVQLSQNKPAAK